MVGRGGHIIWSLVQVTAGCPHHCSCVLPASATRLSLLTLVPSLPPSLPHSLPDLSLFSFSLPVVIYLPLLLPPSLTFSLCSLLANLSNPFLISLSLSDVPSQSLVYSFSFMYPLHTHTVSIFSFISLFTLNILFFPCTHTLYISLFTFNALFFFLALTLYMHSSHSYSEFLQNQGWNSRVHVVEEYCTIE